MQRVCRTVMGMVFALVVLALAGNALAIGGGSLDHVSGWYPAGTNMTVTGSPDGNSTFTSWLGQTNGTAITGNEIQFTVEGPRAITGLFTHISHDIEASVVGNGSITPNGTVPVLQGSNQTFTIVANANHHITGVDVDSSSVGTPGSYTFTNVTAAHTIEATFAIDQYQVVFDLGANGTLGSGSLTQLVNHGSAAVAPTVTPNVGYTFDGWDSAYNNITGPLTVNAQYTLVDYTVIYVTGVNGSISGSTNQTVSHGGSGSQVTAVPDTGYHFVDWSDGILTSARTDTGVTNDITVNANFAINTYTFTVNSEHGTPDPTGVTTSDWNSVVYAAVVDSPVEISGTTQYVATGWVGTGSLVDGSGTNTSFTITNDTTITWQWQTNYWIEFSTTGN